MARSCYISFSITCLGAVGAIERLRFHQRFSHPRCTCCVALSVYGYLLDRPSFVSEKAPRQTLTHFLPSRNNHGLLHVGEGFSGHGTVLEWMSTKLRSPQQCYIPLCILYPSPTAVVFL